MWRLTFIVNNNLNVITIKSKDKRRRNQRHRRQRGKDGINKKKLQLQEARYSTVPEGFTYTPQSVVLDTRPLR
jgi:hypothetical protein